MRRAGSNAIAGVRHMIREYLAQHGVQYGVRCLREASPLFHDRLNFRRG